jgi:hypothetical protein
MPWLCAPNANRCSASALAATASWAGRCWVQLGLLYWPPAQTALDLQPLTLADLAIVLLASTIAFWAIEAEKLVRRLRASRRIPPGGPRRALIPFEEDQHAGEMEDPGAVIDNRCGLIDPANPCRCGRQIASSQAAGSLTPDHLPLARHPREQARVWIEPVAKRSTRWSLSVACTTSITSLPPPSCGTISRPGSPTC